MRSVSQCNGGGMRASRAPADVAALIRTATGSHSAIVDRLSCTDSELRGPLLPRCGEQVELRLEPLSAVGTVRWSAAGRCAVAFDVPLAPFDVLLVERWTGLTQSPAEAQPIEPPRHESMP